MRPAGPQKPSVFALRPPTLLDHFAADLQRIVFGKSAAAAPLRTSCRAIISASFPRGRLGMRRRDFVTILAGAAAYPLLADAQRKAMPVIGILAGASPDNAGAQRMLAAFREGLAEAGYVEGRNIAI